MKSFIIATALIALLASSVYSQDVCSQLTCSKSDSSCATRTGELTYNVYSCDSDSQYCPYLTTLWDKATDAQKVASCADKETTFKSYPGNACSSSTDCINSNACTNGVCVGLGNGETCEQGKHYLCNVGYYCASEVSDETSAYVCRPQSEDNFCTSDYDCPNHMGCAISAGDVSESGVCTAYYSLAVGAVAPPHSIYSFCQTGFAVTVTDTETKTSSTVCASLTLKTGDNDYVECSNDEGCTYEYITSTNTNADATTIQLNNMCQCGYNNTGKKYCRPADGNLTSYDSYIKELTEQLKNTNCHTEERLSCSYIRNNKNFKYLSLYKSKVDTLKNYLFSANEDSQSCLKSVAYPLYESNLVVPTCPIFKSLEEQTDKTCMKSAGYSADSFTVQVAPCADGTYCSYTASDYIVSDAATVSCTDESSALAYPGEKCSADTDCMSVTVAGTATQKCTDNVCVGVAIDATCTADKDCVLGAYCKTGTSGAKTCAAQISDTTTACSNSYQCANNMFCLNEKCVAAFSQTVGTDVSSVESAFRNYVCANNYTFENICSELRYASDVEATDGVVACSYGDNCQYDVTNSATKDASTRSLTQECVCGFNATGQGYCPYSINDYNKTRNKKIIEIYTSALDSSSNHSHNRLNIPSTDNSVCVNVYKNSAYHNYDESVFSVLIDNGSCETINPDKDESSSSSSSTSSGFITVSVFVLFSVFAILF